MTSERGPVMAVRRGRTAVPLGACLWVMVCAAPAAARQAAPPASDGLPAVYVQIGPAVTAHFEGEQYHRASPALTGATVGAALGIGARLSGAVAVEAEVVVDGTLSGTVTDSYFSTTTYTAESRDVLLGVSLRFRPPGGSRLELTAGGGWAASRFARRDIVETRTFPPAVTTYPDTETTIWQPSLHGSLAVAIGLSPRFELVPAVGVRWIRRELDTEPWYFGVGPWTVSAGVAVRVRR